MPNESEEVKLRIGFMPDPDAQAQLDALVKAALDAQARVDGAKKASGSAAMSQQSEVTKKTVEAISDTVTKLDEVTAKQKKSADEFVADEEKKRKAVKATYDIESEFADLFARTADQKKRVDALRNPAPSKPPAAAAAPKQTMSGFEELFGAATIEGAELLGLVEKVEEQIGKGSAAFEEFSKTGSKSLKSLNEELENLRKLAKQGPEELRDSLDSGEIEKAVIATSKLGNAVTKQAQSYTRVTNELETATEQARQFRRQSQASFSQAAAGASRMTTGVTQAARGFVLLNGILEEHKTRVVGASDATAKLDLNTVDLIAKIQGAGDVFRGINDTVRGFVATVDGLVGVRKANVLAQAASNRAAQAEIALSRFRLTQLGVETTAVKSLAAAEYELAAARGLASGRGGGVAAGAAGAVAKRGAGGIGGGIAAGAAGGAAGKIGTGGLVAGGSVGAIAAAGVAALAGSAFFVKSFVEATKESANVGFGQGGEVGGFTDTIASAEVAVLDWIGTTTGAFDMLGSAATKTAEKELAAAKKKEKAQEELDAIRISAEQARFRAEQASAQKLLELRLSLEGKSAADRVKSLGESLSGKQSQLDAVQTGLASDEIRFNRQEEVKLQEQELALLQDVASLRQRTRQEDKAAAREKRSSLLEEINLSEQVLRTRLSEIDALENSVKTAKERFALLDPSQQRKLGRVVDKAKAGGRLSREDINLLGSVDTELTRGLRDEGIDKLAKKGGFDSLIGKEKSRIRELEQEGQEAIDKINAALKEAGSKQSVALLKELQAKIELKPELTIVDQRTFQAETDKVIQQIDESFIDLQEKLFKDIDERIQQKIDNREVDNLIDRTAG